VISKNDFKRNGDQREDVARLSRYCSTTFPLLVALIAVSGTIQASDSANKPTHGKTNLLFVLMDDLGWKDLSCYGSPFIETPVADGLARQGMRFTDAYSAAPVCSPTRASLLTGQYPGRIGMYEVIGVRDRPYAKLTSPPLVKELPESTDTFAEILNRQGYVCGLFGKWHAGRTPQEEGFCHALHQLDDPDLVALAERSPHKRIGHITAQAIRFLRDQRERPFVLCVNHYAVHAPLEAREELIAKYKAKLRRTGVTNIHPAYAAMTEMGDESLGQVLAELERLGLSENTVVIFASDNGGLIEDMYLPEPTPLAGSLLPLRSQKGDLYEGGIRIPLIVRWPGVVEQDSLCQVPVTSCDLFATILDIAGADGPAGQPVDGLSLVPLLRQNGQLNRQALYWHFPTSMWSRWPGGAIRKGNYKLIEFYEDDHVELYDLAADIGETIDLATAYPDLAAELRNGLHRWRESVGAQMPTPNPEYDPTRAHEMADLPWFRKPQPKKKSD